jgi:hypothetical protein
MSRPSTIRLAEYWASCLVLLACTACASFTEGKLPKRSLADLESEGKLTAITYQLSGSETLSAVQAANQASMAPAVVPNVVQSRVEPIFRRVFSESTRQNEPGEWHLDMYYRETSRNTAITFTLATFFVVSLGLFPAYAQDDLYLEVKLRHRGETVKQYIFEESVSTWVHWFVLPWAFSHDPTERKTAILDNMLLNLIYELKNELPHTEPAH